MAVNRGKQFEEKVKEDLMKIPGVSVDRLPDQMSGYKNTSSNISDFIVYKFPIEIYLEAKCCYGNTFNFSNLRQYDKLLSKNNIFGVNPCIVLWFIDHDEIIVFPINTIKYMKDNGRKSINVKDYKQFDCVSIPSIKKRIFHDCDFNVMFDYFIKKDKEKIKEWLISHN